MDASDIFLGNDLVEVSRILSSIENIGQRFIDKIYTLIIYVNFIFPNEIEYDLWIFFATS